MIFISQWYVIHCDLNKEMWTKNNFYKKSLRFYKIILEVKFHVLCEDNVEVFSCKLVSNEQKICCY